MEEINKKIIEEYPNEMEYYGPSIGGRSWNGISTDILKSSVQKYIRRGILDKAIWCINELDLFTEMLRDEDKNRMIKAFSTNIMNRLFIISCEDIGIGNIILPAVFEKLRQEWETLRYDTKNTINRFKILQIMTNLMVNSQKSRELSHIRCVYSTIPNSSKYEHFKNKYSDIYNKEIENGDSYLFTKYFNMNSDKCFYYFFKSLYINDKAYVKNVLPLLDYVINRQIDNRYKKLFIILKKWFRTYKFKEFWLFACQIILISLRKIPFISSDYPSVNFIDLYLNNLNKHKIIIDDYCVDIHTKLGRKNKKSALDFAVDGAFVNNESSFTNKTYKKMYIEYKNIFSLT